MKKQQVIIVQTGLANLASVSAAIKRVGVSPKITADYHEIRNAKFLVLPGVGAFGAGMKELQRLDLIPLIQKRIKENYPTLAICLGFQLLCEESEESPGVKGLGVIPLKVKRFSSKKRVPHMGWNQVIPKEKDFLIKKGFAYFANSYQITEIPSGWKGAYSKYGSTFISGLEKGNILGCQFHPELSGDWGQNLIKKWLTKGETNAL